MVTFPLMALNLTWSPSGLGAEKSGALVPILSLFLSGLFLINCSIWSEVFRFVLFLFLIAG